MKPHLLCLHTVQRNRSKVATHPQHKLKKKTKFKLTPSYIFYITLQQPEIKRNALYKTNIGLSSIIFNMCYTTPTPTKIF